MATPRRVRRWPLASIPWGWALELECLIDGTGRHLATVVCHLATPDTEVADDRTPGDARRPLSGVCAEPPGISGALLRERFVPGSGMESSASRRSGPISVRGARHGPARVPIGWESGPECGDPPRRSGITAVPGAGWARQAGWAAVGPAATGNERHQEPRHAVACTGPRDSRINAPGNTWTTRAAAAIRPIADEGAAVDRAFDGGTATAMMPVVHRVDGLLAF